MEASKIQFSCANPEKSEKTRKRLQHIVDQEDNKLDFDKHKSNPLPTSILVRVPSLLICHSTKIRKKKLVYFPIIAIFQQMRECKVRK